jgi:hypothetical protein
VRAAQLIQIRDCISFQVWVLVLFQKSEALHTLLKFFEQLLVFILGSHVKHWFTGVTGLVSTALGCSSQKCGEAMGKFVPLKIGNVLLFHVSLVVLKIKI